MNKKIYIKPETTMIKVELESLILGNSISGEGVEGSRPNPNEPPYTGDAASKEDNSSDIWGGEW